MANPPPSTTNLIQLADIRDGVIILKDGSLRAVVQVSAINFDLRSSDEQAAIIQQFQAFLSSVDFPLQIVTHSRKFDITTYLATITSATEQLTNELLKTQAQEYMRFVQELSELSNIMSKNFYAVLPFTIIPTTESKGFIAGFLDVFRRKKPALSADLTAEQLATYKSQLAQRADLVIGGLSGMGLQGHMLAQEELQTLFHDVYNPVVPVSNEPQK